MAHGYGIDHVFFMPFIGPRTLMEMEKLEMRRIQTHGEKAAAYMADAYARVKRGPGLCMAQSVGAVNLAAGLQDAFLACSPVIALTGRELPISQQRHAYQEVDHVKPFTTVAKYSAHVRTPELLPILLRQAFRAATTGTPGPAHLDLDGLAGQAVFDKEADLEVIVEEPFTRVPAFRPEADGDQIAQALNRLARAQRPVIVAGGGVTASDARAELIAFAEKLSIPVATALNAKAMFPPNHPLAVGMPGNYSRECSNRVMCEADLGVLHRQPCRRPGHPRLSDSASGHPDHATRHQRRGTGPQLRARRGLAGRRAQHAAPHDRYRRGRRWRRGRRRPDPDRSAWVARVQELVAAWKEDVRGMWESDVEPMRPERLCGELSDYLPEDVILVSDTGHSGVWTGTMLDLNHPGQSFIRCAGSLGWGLPAAMGAKCAAPDRPVLCFTGDGGIWYHLAELETAFKYNLNTVTVVNNNHSLNQEKGGNEGVYGGQTPGSDDLWIFPDADFAAIARSMGCFGITVNRIGELRDALDQAFASGQPAVVDVKTHLDGIAPAAWLPGEG